MANLTGGLENLLGLNTTAGTEQLQEALNALNAVGVPTTQQLTLPELQKYVSAGVLSPAQYQAISANPEAYQQAVQQNQNLTGQNAEQAALQQLGGIVKAGGSTPINQANLVNNINTTNQAMQAARSGIMENAQERGVDGGGLEFANKLANEQGNAQTANTNAVNSASNNAQLALQALASQGTLGGQMQGQSNQMATNAAQSAQQIAQYNSQLQSAANQYNTQNANTAQQANLANAQNLGNMNTQNANYRTQYNTQLPSQEFNMQMQKAGGLANAYGNQANLAENQAAQQNQFVGNLIGTGATLGGDYMMGNAISNAGKNSNVGQQPQWETNTDQYYKAAHGGEIPGYCAGGTCYAQGGEVHDHALCMKIGGNVPGTPQVDGDSTKNDTVPAMLSPHEIVLPRTVAQAPNAPQAAAQFVAQTKGLQPTASSFADILKLLEANGLELRLSSGGK
jgi:hypothetical protein